MCCLEPKYFHIWTMRIFTDQHSIIKFICWGQIEMTAGVHVYVYVCVSHGYKC